jgi:hypothetical protein
MGNSIGKMGIYYKPKEYYDESDANFFYNINHPFLFYLLSEVISNKLSLKKLSISLIKF